MPWRVPTLEEVRATILRGIQNANPSADVSADSDHWVRATGTASAILGLYQHQEWIARQIIPDLADPDWLERHTGRYGIQRRAAARATGTIRLSGTSGTVVASGLEGKVGDVSYLTTAGGTIGAGGTLDVAAQAAAAGAGGNADPATVMSLVSPPVGVDNQATIVAMTGGADIEGDDSLLARLLDRIRMPPHGGAAHDYRAWALQVSGVRDAYIYTERRHYRSVDVVIVAQGGLPSAQLVADVQAIIDVERPVTADALVFGPTAVAVAVTANLVLSGTTLASATEKIRAALEAYFATLKPGDTAYRNRIAAIIADTPGVVDFDLTAPAANVVTVVDAAQIQLATLGAVTLT